VKVLAGIIAGNRSDLAVLELAQDVLVEVNVPTEVIVLSDYPDPLEKLHIYAMSAERKGVEVIIAGESDQPYLISLLTSITSIPVIHVPIPGTDKKCSRISDWQNSGTGSPFITTNPGDAHVAGLWAAQKLAADHWPIYNTLEKLRNHAP